MNECVVSRVYLPFPFLTFLADRTNVRQRLLECASVASVCSLLWLNGAFYNKSYHWIDSL